MSKHIEYPNKKFMARLPRYEPIVDDHTAQSVFDECDRKYFYRVILGKVPARSNNQVVLDAGTLYHKFREVLELTYKATKDFDRAYGEALKPVLTGNLDIPPDGSKFSYIDRRFLVKCCALAFERWKKEKADGKIEVIATEQPFNCRLPDGSFIGGRADEIVRWGGSIYGRDFKFSSKNKEMWSRLINPNEQATRYIVGESEVTGERVEGIIFEVLHHDKGIKKDDYEPRIEIIPHLAGRTDNELREWIQDRTHINRQRALNREYDIWPKREFKTNCAWCDFAIVCRQENEEAQMAKLETNYKTQPWDFEHTEQEVVE